MPGCCRGKFIADPARVLAEERRRGGTGSAAGHERYLPDASGYPAGGPGSCPICGMALERVSVTAEAAPNAELIDMMLALLDRHGIGGTDRGSGDGRAFSRAEPSPLFSPQLSVWI